MKTWYLWVVLAVVIAVLTTYFASQRKSFATLRSILSRRESFSLAQSERVPYFYNTKRYDLSGDWQNGPPWNTNPVHFHVTQVGLGDDLTSDDPTYGHAMGHFTSFDQITMSWPSATWTAVVNSDQITWNNQSVWWRRGEIQVSTGSVDANAGQADHSTNPECQPFGPAQCGWIVIHDISPGGPSGQFMGVAYPTWIVASYWGPQGGGYCEWKSGILGAEAGPAGGAWLDCKSYAIFDRIIYGPEGNGKIEFRARFKNWASVSQKGTITIRSWKWTP